jgi:hypothetical protein
VLSLRDRYDAEQARIKAEAERIENERKAGIKAKITALLNLVATSYRDSAAQLKATLDDLANYELTEADFAEFVGEAAEAKAQALAGLQDLHAKATAAEEEAARLEAERAELQRIQAEAAKQRHEEEARQAAEAARLKAEREAFEAERRAFQEQQAAAAVAARTNQPDMQEKIASAAEQVLADHAAAIDIILSDTTLMLGAADADADLNEWEPLADLLAADEIASDGIHTYPAVASAPSFSDDGWQGRIECLCLVLSDLRAMGMSNETILVTVGEALEAIDAKEAA